MSNVGGFFCSQPLPPKDGDRDTKRVRQYAFVWGKAIRDADELAVEKRTVSFYIKYGEEPNRKYRGQKGEKRVLGKFIKCQAKGKSDAAAVMSAVEKGDIVLCFGRLVKDYKTMKTGEKCYYYMTVDVIVPMAAVAFLLRLYESGAIRKLLQAEDNESADVWESD